MKGWVEKARRPEMIGGIGGFAGLFDASALKDYDRPLLATSADGVGTKVAIAQAIDKHDTIGFDLVGHARRRPRRLRRRAALPHRLHRHRPGRARADRRDRQGHRRGLRRGRLRADRRRDRRAPRAARARTSTTSPARPPAWSRPTGCSGPGRVRPGDAVVAMAASGLHSNGYSLVRHVLLPRPSEGAPAGRSTGTSTSSAARWARSCSSPPGSTPRPAWRWPAATETHAMSHVTGGGLAANLRGCCRSSSTPRSSAARGPRRRSSTWCAGWATYRRPTSSRPSTAASAWSRWSRPTTSTGRSAVLAEHGVRRVGVRARSTGRRLRRGPADGQPPRLVSAPDVGRREPVSSERVCGNSQPPGSVGPTRNLTDQTGSHGAGHRVTRPSVRGGRPYGARPSEG